MRTVQDLSFCAVKVILKDMYNLEINIATKKKQSLIKFYQILNDFEAHHTDI